MTKLTEKVRNGEMDGQTVWVCHYNQPDIDKKPLRNVPPTKCLVVSNSELPKNKTVYYSKSHYRPISKKGNATSRIISPVDNTGYRGNCGNMLHTFTNEDDCICEWNDQLYVVAKALTVELATYERALLGKISEINDKYIEGYSK